MLQHAPRASTPATGTPRLSVQAKISRVLVALFVADVIVMASSLVVAWRLRTGLGVWDQVLVNEDPWIFTFAAILVAWLAWLTAHGAYSAQAFGGGPDEFKSVLLASFLTAGTVGMGCYLLDNNLARGFVVLTFVIGCPLLLLERYAARKIVHGLRRRGRFLHRVVAVGGPSAIHELVNVLHRERYVGYEIVGACVPDHLMGDANDVPVPVMGTPDEARRVCEATGADTVLIAGGSFASSTDLRRVGWQLERSDIDLVVIPSLADIAGPRIHLRPVAGLPLMHVEPPQADAAGRWSKRLFDVVGAGFALLVFSPLMLLVAVLIKYEDGGPVLFRQIRIGRDGEAFQCFKFRSMCIDAEEQRADLHEHNEADGVLFKMQNDPRVTGIGRFLRRYSFDELPQLFNVLRGTMSLVGPRPPLPEEVDEYGDDVRRRLLVRPGMTGLWQVSGRSQLNWRETVRLDLFYVDNWSMVSDLIILMKTIRAVIRAHGAY